MRTAVPVHFVYLTAWVVDREIQFRNDLYNRDTVPIATSDSPEWRVFVQAFAP